MQNTIATNNDGIPLVYLSLSFCCNNNDKQFSWWLSAMNIDSGTAISLFGCVSCALTSICVV